MIHPTAEVSEQAAIGSGTYIWHYSQIRENVTIGKNCIIGKGVYIDYDVAIGDNVKIQNGAYVYHGTTLESGVFVGPGAIFTNDHLPRAINPDGSLKGNDDWELGSVHVCYGASVGAGAVILPHVTIGRWAMIGAGAVVTRNVSDHVLAVGNPAHPAGYVCRCGFKLIKQAAGSFHCPQCNSTITV